MKSCGLILLFLFGIFVLRSQCELPASRISQKIDIDGKLDEIAWKDAAMATDFKKLRPDPGTPSSVKTEVRVLYDDYALYVSSVCYDKPEDVSKVLSLRDDFNANVDNFQLIIDTYNDDQNGFVFGVSSMGVQYDAKIFTAEESPELNMVWNSAIQHTDSAWIVEIRIPYSAFRFSKKDVQDWGINFFRYTSRNREESTWNPIKPDFENWVAQCGELKNIQGITPPLRLAFIPYVSAYSDHYDDGIPDTDNWTGSFNGGMDIKMGINEAFTLDLTLVPDFGQVVFDNQVLNLSPFEIQFNENRQFFTEGTELFNKAGLFYSRRIGIQAPYSVLSTLLNEDEQLSNVPSSAQLYNAAKFSGRTKKGLGIGIFNAITAPQHAKATNIITNEVRDIMVSPLTNFNVLVLDQNLKNNSYVTLTNTNVLRNGAFYDANVTGLNVKLNTKSNKFFATGKGTYSGKYNGSLNSDGYNWSLGLGKQKGNLIWEGQYLEESDTYDPNDLGFNTNNNKRNISGGVAYRIFEPFWKINQMAVSLDASYNRLYNPDVYTGSYLSLNFFNNSKKFHASGINVYGSLTPEYDYFEPRTSGRYFTRPQFLSYGAWISTNYQKRFAIDAGTSQTVYTDKYWSSWNYYLSPRVRISNRIFLIYRWDHSFSLGEKGYAVAFGQPLSQSDGIIFGERNRIDIVNTVDFRYTMTRLMGVTFRLRHYRSFVQYDNLFDLESDGSLSDNGMDGLDVNGENVYNTNFNAFTIDFVYRWVFLPGSEINLVWKNSIFSNDKRVDSKYSANLNQLFNNEPLDSFSIKILYWLDYQSLVKKSKK